jgi:hypothetical protein
MWTQAQQDRSIKEEKEEIETSRTGCTRPRAPIVVSRPPPSSKSKSTACGLEKNVKFIFIL